jgi:hypothetical protein
MKVAHSEGWCLVPANPVVDSSWFLSVFVRETCPHSAICAALILASYYLDFQHSALYHLQHIDWRAYNRGCHLSRMDDVRIGGRDDGAQVSKSLSRLATGHCVQRNTRHSSRRRLLFEDVRELFLRSAFSKALAPFSSCPLDLFLSPFKF